LSKRWTHAACFAHYGTKPKNTRWSWSGRSDDGQTVSVTLWQDRFTDQGRTYRVAAGDFGDVTKSKHGYAEFLENLQHAKTHLDGLVRVVVARAEDTTAIPRKIASCHPQDKLIMRVVQLDTEVGSFVLERIEAS
jgi:hypothetical protein